jgi:hypothetical protein
MQPLQSSRDKPGAEQAAFFAGRIEVRWKDVAAGFEPSLRARLQIANGFPSDRFKKIGGRTKINIYAYVCKNKKTYARLSMPYKKRP